MARSWWPIPEDLVFWLAFAYWAGVAGAVGFAVGVHGLSRFPWHHPAAVAAHFTLVFHGTLLFLALAFLVILLTPPEAPPRSAGGGLEAEFRAFLRTRRRRTLPPRPVALALASTLPLALVLLALGLWVVSGAHTLVGFGFATTNALVAFGSAGVLVLLFPGLAYLGAALLERQTAG